MQTVLTNYKTKKWVLFTLGILFFAKGLEILFFQKKDIYNLLESYFRVIGGIAYAGLALQVNPTGRKFFNAKFDPVVRIKLLVLAGIITLTYLVIWLIQYK